MSAAAEIDALRRSNASLREQQRAVGNVMRAVARSEGVQAVVDEVVEAATQICEGLSAQLYLAADGLLRAVAHFTRAGPAEHDLGPAYDKDHPHAFDRTTIAGRAAVTRDVIHIPDVAADPEYAYSGPRQYVRAGLGVPIVFEEELIGVIAVVRDVPTPFADEHIALMRTFADQAAIAIANARLLEAVERQRTELSRFVSPQIADLLTSQRGEELLAGHRAYISVLFSDLRGFTSFVETAAPEELFELLREYHALIGDLLRTYQGTLEHFAGDGVMVFFNDPLPVADHEQQAIRMALALQDHFRTLAAVWRKRGTDLGLGIGIAAGYATLGRIGFEGRYDYTAQGPVTNLASRLSTHARPGQILIGQRVFASIEDHVDTESVGELELKGFGRPITAYEVRGLRR